MRPSAIRSASAALLAAFALLPGAVRAQDSTAAAGRFARRGGSGLPLTPTRDVRFTTDEGTWMSLDLSPDGKTIVFELLGDLYTLPVQGGTATRITSGQEFDSQPRYSPDGKTIVFVSDRSGTDNLWMVNADGSHPHAITHGTRDQFISPEWTPDGKYIVASRNQTGTLGSTYELWMFHRDGGSGLRITGGTQQAAQAPSQRGRGGGGFDNYLGAAFGKDPRYIFASAKRGGFGYNLQFPLWQVVVVDRETGRTYTRTSETGSAMRPLLSPDGRWMVYATRYDTATAYKLRDLQTGDERWLAMNVTRDDQESRFTRDLMPGAAFTPDSKAIIATIGGKFWRVEVPSGKRTPIPFTADVALKIGPVVHTGHRINDSTITVRQIRDAVPSPDGKQLAFTALDRLWVMSLPNGRPHRLTSQDVGEFSPAWSPDGKWVAFVTWTPDGGDIYRVASDGKGAPQKLTRMPAFYDKLTYTPDGSRLVFTRGPRQPRIDERAFEPADVDGDVLEAEPETPVSLVYGRELAWIPAAGGAARPIGPVQGNGQAHFTDDSTRIFIYAPGEGLVSIRWDGTDQRQVLRVTGYTPPSAGGGPPRPSQARDVRISPDGTRAIALVDDNVYLLDVPVAGEPGPTVSATNAAQAVVPVRRVTRVGGDFIGWQPDGRSFHYSLGHSYFTYDVARGDSLVRDSVTRADSARPRGRGARGADSTAGEGQQQGAEGASHPAYEASRTDVVMTAAKDRPTGTVALRGARIITMKGDEVIDDGTIVITNNRIAAVGPRAQVAIPAGATVIDVSGKTIIPGYVDVHAHLRPTFGIHKQQVWEYMTILAYGVTTTRDPQTGTTDVLSYGDLVETGDILGPRIFSTGPGVFSSTNIRSLDDARDVLRRYADYYDSYYIKEYETGERNVRQWVIMAARELGLMPTTEGGLDMRMNLTEMLDGYPGHEHTLPLHPLYKDVVELQKQSGITYTPTLIVQYGGPWAENYFYEHEDIHANAKLRHFTPHSEVDIRGLRRPQWFRDSQYEFSKMAEDLKRMVDAGGNIGLGGHGQLQGLGSHWELWAIGSGGMRPLDVLKVGTINGARALGLDADVGSLEPGKLADLQVLDGNPLENIRNTDTIHWVMKNGRLYEGNTLNEVWPRKREVPPTWWQKETIAEEQAEAATP
ncbi:MAG TPA: amidohydrolase family protein [Gemmatimonadaceae bacterium]|nr:amidohydrolase family protein [Gemmatimonadaceae bacterium]